MAMHWNIQAKGDTSNTPISAKWFQQNRRLKSFVGGQIFMVDSDIRIVDVLSLLFGPQHPHKQILHADLYTCPWRISWENLIKDQNIYRLVLKLF